MAVIFEKKSRVEANDDFFEGEEFLLSLNWMSSTREAF
jgi:hypothetical protein